MVVSFYIVDKKKGRKPLTIKKIFYKFFKILEIMYISNALFKTENLLFCNYITRFCLCFVKVMLKSVNRLNIEIFPFEWWNL